MTRLRKTIAATLAAATFAGSVAISTTSAEARYRRGWHGPAAVGVIGALALGAMAAGAYANGPYYNGPYYGHGCFERRPIYNRWGDFIGYRRVRVC